MATNTLGSVTGKVKTFRDRITDVLNTICTEKPLKIETSTKLEGELKAILEGIAEFSEELVNLKQPTCELEAKPIDVEGNITKPSRRRGKSKFLDQHSNERVRALEAEVESLKTQVIKLLAQISEVEGDKMVLEERVVNLEGTVKSLKEGNVKLQSNVTSLTNEVAKLKVSDDELFLGQLCWRIQSMIFKKVLPPSQYNENVSYKLYLIKHDIDALGNDEDIKESEQAWAKLQDELSLHERDVKKLAIAMRNTQSQRNFTAHPPLTEQKLLESANRMNGKGELKTSYGNITKLINLWKELEKLQ